MYFVFLYAEQEQEPWKSSQKSTNAGSRHLALFFQFSTRPWILCL